MRWNWYIIYCKYILVSRRVSAETASLNFIMQTTAWPWSSLNLKISWHPMVPVSDSLTLVISESVDVLAPNGIGDRWFAIGVTESMTTNITGVRYHELSHCWACRWYITSRHHCQTVWTWPLLRLELSWRPMVLPSNSPTLSQNGTSVRQPDFVHN